MTDNMFLFEPLWEPDEDFYDDDEEIEPDEDELEALESNEDNGEEV